MSKVITSPVKKWPGTVTLSDPLVFPQVFAFEDADKETQALVAQAKAEAGEGEEVNLPHTLLDSIWVKAIVQCVEEWHLEGLGQLSEDNFPAAPRLASYRLIAWLIREITAIYQDAENVPNA